MLLDLFLILVGLGLVLWGANILTEGAVGLAQRMNIPPIVIGLTVVAFGTSAPEFFVSFLSALKGTADLAVGNIVGSNIFNALLIVGCAAIIAPMSISKSTVRKDMPFALLASGLLFVMCLDRELSRIDSALLLVLFGGFLVYTLHVAKTGSAETTAATTPPKTLKAVLMVVVGLVALVIGSDLFVNNATDVAKALGVSDAVIGLTIVAGGTSMPELATSIVAARKGQSAIAIGNVIGSNVFNILMILGLTGIITPMHLKGITMLDFAVLTGSMLLLIFFSFTRYTISRLEGGLLALLYVGYVAWLIAGC